MIGVFGVDEQDDLDIDVARWVRLAEQVLAAEKIRRASEMTLLFVDESVMADLNAKHMGGDGPTDVLAFPIDDDVLEPGRFPDNGTSGPDRTAIEIDDLPTLLGDVVICPSVAARNAADHAGAGHHRGTVEDEIALLVVHGILHVLGMDHVGPEDTAAMQTREQELLARFHTEP